MFVISYVTLSQPWSNSNEDSEEITRCCWREIGIDMINGTRHEDLREQKVWTWLLKIRLLPFSAHCICFYISNSFEFVMRHEVQLWIYWEVQTKRCTRLSCGASRLLKPLGGHADFIPFRWAWPGLWRQAGQQTSLIHGPGWMDGWMVIIACSKG
jgi:hypothetical protein